MSKLQALSDEALLSRMRQGDEAALATLYARHHGSVYRYVLMMAGSHAQAADASQEAFLLLIQSPERFDPQRGVLVSFLIGVARNKLRQDWDRQMVSLDEDGDEPVPEAMHEHTPLHALIANQELTALRQAIAAIPLHYREVLLLCDLQELPYADAASMLDCPVGTVRSRLNRARNLLIERLAPRNTAAIAPAY